MTDKDIIKAAEWCFGGTSDNCRNCPLEYTAFCEDVLQDNILDLINRQQAEIEKLQNLECFKKIIFRRMHTNYKTGLSWEFPTEEAYNEAFEKEVEKLYDIATATVEAYKEFAERLKKEADTKLHYGVNLELEETECVEVDEIDNLVKEMMVKQNDKH